MGSRICLLAAARSRARASKPSMNSRAMKYWPFTSPKSMTWTIFGWMSCAVSLASSMNIETKVLSAARCGRIRLMTSELLEAVGGAIFALKTSAIPPVASRSVSVYRPNGEGNPSFPSAGITCRL